MATPHTLESEEWERWNTWMRAQQLLLRELDRDLQRDYGISKAEFSVLVTLHRTSGGRMRVGELAESLDWDKSRVAHQLTRMENRGLVGRTDNESSGRRLGVELTAKGRNTAQNAILGHADNIRRYFFDTLTREQAAAIDAWSRQMVDRAEARAEGRSRAHADGRAEGRHGTRAEGRPGTRAEAHSEATADSVSSEGHPTPVSEGS